MKQEQLTNNLRKISKNLIAEKACDPNFVKKKTSLVMKNLKKIVIEADKENETVDVDFNEVVECFSNIKTLLIQIEKNLSQESLDSDRLSYALTLVGDEIKKGI